MAKWSVVYQGPDKKGKTTWVSVPDEFNTARKVHEALEEGDVPGAYFTPGSIVSVQKWEPSPGPMLA